jgi:hypothetical protein
VTHSHARVELCDWSSWDLGGLAYMAGGRSGSFAPGCRLDGDAVCVAACARRVRVLGTLLRCGEVEGAVGLGPWSACVELGGMVTV